METGPAAKKTRYRKLGGREEMITAYLMIAPDVLGLLVFIFIPIVYAFYISLHDWNGITEMTFAGIKNYSNLMKDNSFWQSLWVTIKYALLYVPAVFCVSLLLASLLHGLKGKRQAFFRTAFFMPYAISTVIAGLIWVFVYDPMKGYLNQFLRLFGVSSQAFLGSTTQALPSIAVVGVWLVLGYNMILFLSAIKDIPSSYYEAADIDGANSVHKFFYITLPLLKNTSMFILVMTTINSFQAFDQIKVMTNGGPANATMTTVLYIFRQAFEVNKMGYSSAIAFVLFVMIMLMTLLQMKLSGGNEKS